MTPRFSERVGAVKFEVQLGSMNDALKNSIWNVVTDLITYEDQWAKMRKIAAGVLRLPKESVSYADPRGWLLKSCFKNLDWAGWYDLLEYVVENASEFSAAIASPDTR